MAPGKVISQFPGVFNGGPPGGAAAGGRWNPMADCSGVSAQDRCTWLQNSEGMNLQAARAKVQEPELRSRYVLREEQNTPKNATHPKTQVILGRLVCRSNLAPLKI